MTPALPPAPPGPPDPGDEVPQDDAVIGRAFRRSLAVIAALGAVGALAWWLTRPAPSVAPQAAAPVAAPHVRAKAERAPAVSFTDVTAAAGIGWKHVTGGTGMKWLPETMGPGCAFLDLEDDGDPDLLLVNGAPWPGESLPPGTPPPTPALYRNDGRGRFEDVTRTFGLDVTFYGMGVAVGDADGDGDRDLLFTGVGGNRYFRREGERFADATADSGLAGDPGAWTTGAGFFDADRDGDLDLLVCSYVRWSQEIDRDIHYTLDGTTRAFGPPKNYEGSVCRLYKNDGRGRFEDVTEAAGLVVRNANTRLLVAKALAVLFLDVDEDGAVDVFVANDTTPNFLFKNRGDGTFEEVGARSGVAYDAQGNSTGAMGADAADVRGDGKLAIAVGNFANEMTSLYVAPRDPWRFTDMTIAEGIGAPSRQALKFGVLFLDYDLDGRADFFQTNGHLEEEIEKVQRSQRYRQPSQLFWNLGPEARACFGEVPSATVGDLARPVVGRGAAYADIDGDGDLDLLITQCGEAPLLLRNDQALGHHWLRVRLVGRAGNPDGLGARLELMAGGRTQRRWVSPTRSYLSQVEPTVTFGLGGGTAVEGLVVHWPDGTRQEVAVTGVDRVLVVRQP
jgi:hypothetical protein